MSALETLSLLGVQLSLLVQFWGATKINGKVYLLTTTSQPFGFSGNNEELKAYREACLHHKLYVYEDSENKVAFGLPGHVFLYRTPAQAQNMHAYPEDQRPPCEDAIFTKAWGSFALPVIHDDKCVGVLEVIMDTPKDSYGMDIAAVYRVLEHAGFQPPTQMDGPAWTPISGRKRKRVTKTSHITKYSCLVPLFGLSSARATEKLGLPESTFRYLCRNVGISEWPCIPAARASSIPETQTVSESFADSISIRNEEIPVITSDNEASVTSANYGELTGYQGSNELHYFDVDGEEWLNEYIRDHGV